MKTNRFLSLAAIFAITFTFLACSSDDTSPPSGGEPSSDSSGNAVKLCGNVEYDDSIYRCEYGELIGKCNGMDFRPAYQVCNDGVIEDKNPLSSGYAPSSSSNGGSPSSTVIPEAFQFLGSGYNVISSAYINPSGAIKHRNYPVLNREKMFQDGLFASTKQPQESFSTVAGSSIKETIHKRSEKIGASVEANLPSLPFFSGEISGDYENVKNSKMLESMSFAKLNYYNYKEELSIKSATKEKLKDYLTDAFKNNLKVKNAAEIIELYGTHVFVQYYNGGSLEANYTYAYNGKEELETVKTAAAVTFKGIPGVSVSGDVSNSTNTSNLAKEENLAFKYHSFGGNTIAAGDLATLKSKFHGWATSIKESNAVICGIANFKSSLIPIWDLASAGGFSTEANALKTEFNSRAGSIKFPAARFYKVEKMPDYTTSGVKSLSFPNGTIAEIEIYALGAGGGGQGGSDGLTSDGTGGAGGGGAATYVKLKPDENDKNSLDLTITIGKGGTGGNFYDGVYYSGYAGNKGTDTKVVYKTATITASGGFGAGTNESSNAVTGGAFGTSSTLPTSSNFYLAGRNAAGTSVNNGSTGNNSSDIESKGGTAMKFENVGTLPTFGGGNGAVRPKGASATNTTSANKGGGGRGGYSKNSGTSGGDGLVNIVVKYYWEEGGTEANPQNYGTACNSYCRWDTGCFEIRTDPDGIYGDANSTCSDAITNCDYYGQGRYSNATCSGTPISSEKPQSCGSYCRWETGCFEIKTDPKGIYGDKSTSCTTAISICDEWGERYNNSDCL